jgi:hypothetical protein
MRNPNRFRFLLSLLVAAGLQLGLASLALAHGDAPARFGGIVKSSQEISFELVAGANGGAQIHMDDHGDLMDTTGITGKLTVIGAAGKKEAALAADGKKLVATGLNPASGDRVVVVVTLPSQKTVSVRYAIP